MHGTPCIYWNIQHLFNQIGKQLPHNNSVTGRKKYLGSKHFIFSSVHERGETEENYKYSEFSDIT